MACKPKYDGETLMECGTLDACVAISERLKSSVCMLAILVVCVRYAMLLSNVEMLCCGLNYCAFVLLYEFILFSKFSMAKFYIHL